MISAYEQRLNLKYAQNKSIISKRLRRNRDCMSFCIRSDPLYTIISSFTQPLHPQQHLAHPPMPLWSRLYQQGHPRHPECNHIHLSPLNNPNHPLPIPIPLLPLFGMARNPSDNRSNHNLGRNPSPSLSLIARRSPNPLPLPTSSRIQYQPPSIRTSSSKLDPLRNPRNNRKCLFPDCMPNPIPILPVRWLSALRHPYRYPSNPHPHPHPPPHPVDTVP